jgi:CRISPR-associated endonuclease/helicase Cas3
MDHPISHFIVCGLDALHLNTLTVTDWSIFAVTAYAHTHPHHPDNPSRWEPLFTPFGEGDEWCQWENCQKCSNLDSRHGHLNKVAWWTAKFASEMFPPGLVRDAAHQWGYLAGLWHDLGKFAPEWQTYLASKADPHADEVTGKVDHSTAGARHAAAKHLLGHLIAYPIAGHHSGLLDGESNHACQRHRLGKSDLPDWSCAPTEILDAPLPPLPPFLKSPDDFSLGFFSRLIFSCLVDADFLATEAFMNSRQALIRNNVRDNALQQIADLVRVHIDSFGTPAPADIVNMQRKAVVEDCRAASGEKPGLFTLTVPTGGGKTLSSLLFAILHAIANGQKRVIFVVPFTSIIEQNAEVIRKIVAPLQTDTFIPLIEHHSALSPEKETERSRLAAENWDAPIIITTAVQFYESLFASKTSRCRKLHHIANSVVILDEAQTVPVDFLAPCLRVLRELTHHYHSTVVLCTATQPAIHHHPDEFPIGLKGCREIIRDPASLFASLKRVDVHFTGHLSDADLAQRLHEHPQALCIVNRRKHAREIFRLLGSGKENFHLSALMCPEHRSRILEKVRDRLQNNLPVRLISTQLIEAGVDVDFPVVYRSIAGLDSIAQSAGRCNRNGKLDQAGQTYVFIPEDQKGEAYFRETAQVASGLIDLHPDLLSREAIHAYFDLYYYQQKSRWDSKGILSTESFRRANDRNFPFHFQFATVAEKFRLIDDWQVPVIIPYDEKARKLIKDLANPAIPLNRNLLRALQRYTVQISPKLRDENIRSFDVLRDGQFHALISGEINYSNDFGITFDEQAYAAANYIC